MSWNYLQYSIKNNKVFDQVEDSKGRRNRMQDVDLKAIESI